MKTKPEWDADKTARTDCIPEVLSEGKLDLAAELSSTLGTASTTRDLQPRRRLEGVEWVRGWGITVRKH